MKKTSRILIVSLFTAGALALASCSALGQAPTQQLAASANSPSSNGGIVSVEGRIVPRDSATLTFPVSGEVAQVPVKEGQTVSKGTLLAALGKRESAQASLSAAKLEQVNAQQQLDKLKRDADVASGQASQAAAEAQKAVTAAQKAFDDVDTEDYRQKIDDQSVELQKAKDKLKDEQEELDKYKDLDSDNQTRKDAQKRVDDAQITVNKARYEYNQLKDAFDKARAELDAAKAKQAKTDRDYASRRKGPDPEDLALAQARLDNANAQVDSAARALDNLDLKAPFDGTVADLNHLAAGKWVTATTPAITFADFSAWYVETKDLTELDVVKIEKGQKVSVVPDAIKDVKLSGEVEWISQAFQEKSGDILYTARIRIEKPDSRLRWGMTANVTFEK